MVKLQVPTQIQFRNSLSTSLRFEISLYDGFYSSVTPIISVYFSESVLLSSPYEYHSLNVSLYFTVGNVTRIVRSAWQSAKMNYITNNQQRVVEHPFYY
jgi:hypothetical protein